MGEGEETYLVRLAHALALDDHRWRMRLGALHRNGVLVRVENAV